MKNKLYVILLIMLTCVGCDQITKSIAKDTLRMSPPRTYLSETFRLQYAENTGAFLSLGSGLPKVVRTWLFTFLSGGLLIGLLLYMLMSRDLNRQHIFALSMILGGGFSNLIDRMLHDGRVVDFMNMGIGNVRTGIFNFADVLIMSGMGLIILFNLHLHRKTTTQEITQKGEFPQSEESE